MKKFLYTPIPNLTDTTGAPPVVKMRAEKGDEYVYIYMRILWSFWSGEGLVMEDGFTSADIARIFDAMYEDENYDVILYVIDFMIENSYIAMRDYKPERDGVPSFTVSGGAQ